MLVGGHVCSSMIRPPIDESRPYMNISG